VDLDLAFSSCQGERGGAYLGDDCETRTQTGSGSELGGSHRGNDKGMACQEPLLRRRASTSG